MHPRWMEKTNEERIHSRSMDQIRKFRPTAQRFEIIGKDDEQVDWVEDREDGTQAAKTATPSQTRPTNPASSSPCTSSTLSSPSQSYEPLTSIAMNVYGPQPTFTASCASARPPLMAPRVAPSLSGFSSFASNAQCERHVGTRSSVWITTSECRYSSIYLTWHICGAFSSAAATLEWLGGAFRVVASPTPKHGMRLNGSAFPYSNWCEFCWFSCLFIGAPFTLCIEASFPIDLEVSPPGEGRVWVRVRVNELVEPVLVLEPSLGSRVDLTGLAAASKQASKQASSKQHARNGQKTEFRRGASDLYVISVDKTYGCEVQSHKA